MKLMMNFAIQIKLKHLNQVDSQFGELYNKQLEVYEIKNI